MNDGRSFEQVLADIVAYLDAGGDGDGLLDRFELDELIAAMVAVGGMKPEDVDEVKKFWDNEIQADEVDPMTLAIALKEEISKDSNSPDIDAEMNMAVRYIEYAILNGPPQPPPMPSPEEEMMATLKHLLELLDHAEQDGKIHLWELNNILYNAESFGLMDMDTVKMVENWFNEKSLEGADFDTFGKALIDLLIELGVDV